MTTTVGHNTNTLVSESSSSAGKVYTFRDTFAIRESNSDPADKSVLAPISATQTLKYLLLGNGTVEAPIENQINLQSQLEIRGHVIFPTISELDKGDSKVSALNFTYVPSTPAGIAAVKEMTNGSKSLTGIVEYRLTGVFRKTLTTPSGRFQDLVGLHQKITSVSVENANQAGAAAFDAGFLNGAGQSSSTIWYAPGHGSVSTWSYSSGKRTIENVSCNK